jgi:hypothetical protein
MHHHYVDREFLLAMLAFPLILCMSFITETPTALVILAGFMIMIGIWGLFNGRYLPLPWLIIPVSTVMVVLGVGFLIWYFSVGRTLLHPIFDAQKIFESINESLVTPTP